MLIMQTLLQHYTALQVASNVSKQLQQQHNVNAMQLLCSFYFNSVLTTAYNNNTALTALATACKAQCFNSSTKKQIKQQFTLYITALQSIINNNLY